MKKIAIIYDTSKPGLGGHGTHLAFRGLPGVEIVALADSNVKDIETRLNETGAQRHYTDYQLMLEKERPDIVVLGSRLPGDHFAQIEAAAKLGTHILCEKPMSADLNEADQIVRLAEKYQIKIAVAHLARYATVFRTMKQMIDTGAIGRPLTFYGRGKEDERGGGEDMFVLGTHILDLGCFLFGKPDSVFAEVSVEGRPLRRTDRSTTKEPIGLAAGDSILAFYHFPNEVKGIFESRKGLFKKQVRMGITVAGTEGILSVRYDNDRKLRLSRTPFPPEDDASYEEVPLTIESVPGAEPIDSPENAPVFSKYLKYFAENNRFAAWDLMQAIDENRAPAASATDAQFTLEMIYAVYASQLEESKISLPLSDRNHPLA